MPTEKSESKPETTEDPATDEEHPQDALRREGLRLNPQFQTEHLDTTGGGPVDIHRISSVFEEARQHAVRAAALAADEDYAPDNVVFSDDHDEADRQREHVRKLAEQIPDEEAERRPAGTYADGMGGPYGQGVVPTEDDGDSKGEATTAKSTTSSTSTAAKTPAKSTSTSTTAKKTETK
jgi:hypothetical protein